ncbi:Retrovirus-related Pol polyprotein from type-2 retrotransposable element R2DM [Merluccius polli]|uniref:Retrovirus-related Pol polyprotein from type-2 retrotransposable element R2DM n=4 Tax=Merluccius polli TaxID=89951 RepID=A0AA47MAL5_MERPO|nr:Retrovirus-related Pol polyprotein from type-2 retrotransposable element R2DM [Merluccius polli]
MASIVPENTTPAPGKCQKTLQSCICGWTKVTSTAGLKIHQGKKKCLKKVEQGPRIDHYFLRSRSSQSSEVQRQDENQSPQNINPPVPEEEEGSSTAEHHEPSQHHHATETKTQERMPPINWPKSCEKKVWETVNTDLILLLEQLGGTAVKKLERLGDLIYSYGAERFGVADKRRSIPSIPSQSRRQQEIERLVKERRGLKKQWRKAPEEEKEGINVLQAEIKNRLSALRRAENLRKRRKKKERARSNFFKDPFKFVKGLFTKEKSGNLQTTKECLEAHLSQTHSDSRRHEQVTLPHDMPPLHPPKHQLDVSPPKWSEVERTVRRARAASSPGLNGVPYKLYKYAPDVLRFLWRLMRVMWLKRTIPTVWQRAGSILIPKEKDSTDISQFRQISLLNVEGKIFFSVVARRLTTYLEMNHFIDTSVQKAGMPGFPGCMEHLSMIWHQVQGAKRDGRDLHVIFLDLANAFGSVPHNILWTAFSYFQVPEAITSLVKAYFRDVQICLSTSEYTTAWQHLEVGIMAGCTISPLAFTMAMEVIIRASRWVVGGEQIRPGLRLPPIRAYMDDMTTLTSTIPCTRRLLRKLQENIEWARMKFKPSKSRSLSVVKGKLSDQRFYIGEEPIPTVAEKPIKSLGRWYDATLKDTVQVEQLRQDTISGLQSIEKTMLPGRLKLWCLQFGLLPRLMWPLTIYEVPISKVDKLERLVSSFARKWLGVPRCLSNIALYGKGILELPLSSLTEEYKSTKVRLQMMLTESRDPCVAKTAPTLSTGRKWTPAAATHQAKSALKHRDIVGAVQRGRGGLGLGESEPSWHKASPAQRRGLVVEEVRREEQAARCAKAVSQGKQGQWMRWEDVEKRKFSWKEIWDMEAFRTSFILRATYDVLPSPQNLNQWYGEDPTCHLCPSPANLKHILVACKTSLTQGRYTWRHNQVLKCLAAALESRRTVINALPSPSVLSASSGQFVREGEKPPKTRQPKPETGHLGAARDWRLLVDLEQRLCFPAEIAPTNLRPDLVLWSPSIRSVYIIELTVPWEDNVGEAYERKKLRYAELAADAEQRGWKATVRPVEVGCRGFVGRSVPGLLKDMGIRGQAQQQTIKALSSAAERASQWLWIRRRDNSWAPK